MNIRNLQRILRWRSGAEALRHLRRDLRRQGYTPIQGSGYVYAPGTVPILLAAHVDTVHPHPPRDIYYDPAAQVMWSPDGLGADDRAGVWAIMEVLHTGRRPHILFTDGEEQGGWGACCAVDELSPPEEVRCIVELDRRGANDAVYYDCGSEAMREWVHSFGFQEAHGTFTDISILCPEWNLAGVNLSVGYYQEHTQVEYLRLAETAQTIERVCRMVDAPPQQRLAYEAVEREWSNLWRTSSYRVRRGRDLRGDKPLPPVRGERHREGRPILGL